MIALERVICTRMRILKITHFFKERRLLNTVKMSLANELIDDIPKGGPLETYRKRATFDWKLFKLKLEGEQYVRYQKELWTLIKTHPAFQESTEKLQLDDIRRRCQTQIKAILEKNVDILNIGKFLQSMYMYDASIPIKFGVSFTMVPGAILALGTEIHNTYLEKFASGEYIGCFALTEISHGTNVKGMQTTATYDVKTKRFILHSSSFEAAKCWVGALGKTATHALVYAQLITPDGVNRGLHTFIVPIRDPKTHLPFPGVLVGDLGEKIGLNGVDNGFAMFNKYPLPHDSLLNRSANVSEDGTYTTSVKNESKRFGASLGALSGGRVAINVICVQYMSLALTIAVRYNAVRKQFGPSEDNEFPVIEYQAQQLRLIPHLAETYAIKIFSKMFYEIMLEFNMKRFTNEKANPDLIDSMGMELHALSSATKPFSSWTARDAIQDCRECCGGHGYLKMSRLGDIRANNDANCTYEGENNVLIQQASNWLLNQWDNMLKDKLVPSPLHSINFLVDANEILKSKFKETTLEDTLNIKNLLEALQWLVCYYLQKTYERVKILKSSKMSDFDVRNNTQAFLARTLSLVYAEHTVMLYFAKSLQHSYWEPAERQVLTELCSLFGAVILEKRLGDLYAGGYASPDSKMDELLRKGIINLCSKLVNNAVTLVDAMAPPDFIVNSPLGMSDGEVYKHIEEWLRKNQETFERPSWWEEIRSKL